MSPGRWFRHWLTLVLLVVPYCFAADSTFTWVKPYLDFGSNGFDLAAFLFSDISDTSFTSDHTVELDLLKEMVVQLDIACSASHAGNPLTITSVTNTTMSPNVQTIVFRFSPFTAAPTEPLNISCTSIGNPATVSDADYTVRLRAKDSSSATVASLEIVSPTLTQFVFGSSSLETITTTPSIPLSNTGRTLPITISGLNGFGPALVPGSTHLVIEFPSQWRQTAEQAKEVAIRVTIGSEIILASSTAIPVGNRAINGYRIPISTNALNYDDISTPITITMEHFGMPARPLANSGILNVYTIMISDTSEKRLTASLRVSLPTITPMVITDTDAALIHSTHVADTWGSVDAKVTHDALGVAAGEIFMVGFPTPPSTPGVPAVDPWRFKRYDLGVPIGETNNTYSKVLCTFSFVPAAAAHSESKLSYSPVFAYGYSKLTDRTSELRMMTFGGVTYLEYVLPDPIPYAGTSRLNCTGIATPNVAVPSTTPSVIQFATYSPQEAAHPSPFATTASVKFAGVVPRGTLGKPTITFSPFYTGATQATLTARITTFGYPLLRPTFLYTIHLPEGFLVPAGVYCQLSVNGNDKVTGALIVTRTPDYAPQRDIIKVIFPSVSLATTPSQFALECYRLQLPPFVVEPRSNIIMSLSVFGDHLTIAEGQVLPEHGLRMFQEEFVVASNRVGEMQGVFSQHSAGTLRAEMEFTSPAPAVNSGLDFALTLSPLLTAGSDYMARGNAIEVLLPGARFDANGLKSSCVLTVNTDPDPNSFHNFPDVGFEFFVTDNIIRYDPVKRFVRVRARFNADYSFADLETQRTLSMACNNIGMSLTAFDQGPNALYRIVNQENKPLISNVTVWTPAIAPRSFASALVLAPADTVLAADMVTDLQFRFSINNMNIQQSEFLQNATYYQLTVALQGGFSVRSLYGFSCTSNIGTFTPSVPHTQDERAAFQFPLPRIANAIRIDEVYNFTCHNISTPISPIAEHFATLSIVTGPRMDIFARGTAAIPAVVAPEDNLAFGARTRTVTVGYAADTQGSLVVSVSPPAITELTDATSMRVALPSGVFALTPENTVVSACEMVVNADTPAEVVLDADFNYVTPGKETMVTVTPVAGTKHALTSSDTLSMYCSALPRPRSVQRSRHAVVSLVDTQRVPTYPHHLLHILTNAHVLPYADTLFASGGVRASFSPDSIGSVSTYVLTMQHTPAAQTSLLGTTLFLPVPSDTNRTKDTPNSSIACTASVNGGTARALTGVSFEYPFTHIAVSGFATAVATAIDTPTTASTVTVRCTNIRAPRHFRAETLLLTAYNAAGAEVARNPYVAFAGMGPRAIGTPRTLALTPPYVMPLPDGALTPSTTSVTLDLTLEPLPFQLLKGDVLSFQIHPSLYFPDASACTVNGVPIPVYSTDLGEIDPDGGDSGGGGGGGGEEEFPGEDDDDHHAPGDPDDFLPARRKPRTLAGGYLTRGLISLPMPQDMPYDREHPTPLTVVITNVVPPVYAVSSELDYHVVVLRPDGEGADGKPVYRTLAETHALVWGGVLPLQLGTSAFATVALAEAMRLTTVNVTLWPLPVRIDNTQLIDILYPSSYDMLFSLANFPPTTCHAVRQANDRSAPDDSVPLAFVSAEYTMNTIGADTEAAVTQYTVVSFTVPPSAALLATDASGSLTITCASVRMPSTEQTARVRVGLGIRDKPTNTLALDGARASSSPAVAAMSVGSGALATASLSATAVLDPTVYTRFTSDLTFPPVAFTPIGADYLFITTGSRVAGEDSQNLTLSLRPLPVELGVHSVVEVAFPVGGWRLVDGRPVTCEFQYYSTNKASYESITGVTSVATTSTSLTLRFNFTTLPSGTYEAYVSKLFCDNIHIPTEPIRLPLENINVQASHITRLSPHSVVFMQNKRARMHATFPPAAQEYYTYITQKVQVGVANLLSPAQLAEIERAYLNALASIGLRGLALNMYRLDMTPLTGAPGGITKSYEFTLMFQKPDTYTAPHATLLDSLSSLSASFHAYFNNQLQHAGIASASLSPLNLLDLTANCSAEQLDYDGLQECGDALVKPADFCMLGLLDCKTTNAATVLSGPWRVVAVAFLALAVVLAG